MASGMAARPGASVSRPIFRATGYVLFDLFRHHRYAACTIKPANFFAARRITNHVSISTGQLRSRVTAATLEHADRTPSFWLGDAAWDATRRSSVTDWDCTRACVHRKNSTRFNGRSHRDRMCKAMRHSRAKSRSPSTRISSSASTQKLTRSIARVCSTPLRRCGKSASSADDRLPEDQAIALLRYAIARWGGNDVAWILAFEGEGAGRRSIVGNESVSAVFGDISHAPVVLLPGETYWLFDEFRNEDWVDVFGCQTARVLDEDSLQWLLTGPLTLERRKQPTRPLITLAPPAENAPTREPGKRLEADLTRRLLWWSALLNTPAGVSYSAQGVAHGELNPSPRAENDRHNLPAWQRELFLPGARDIEALGDFFSSIDYWRLQPFSRAIPDQPGLQTPRRYIPAEGTEAHDLVGRLCARRSDCGCGLGAMPKSPSAKWINTRDGKQSPAVAVVSSSTCQFPTPDAGDWVLVIKAGK